MFIYIVKNKLNGKRYVGKTSINVEHRWKKHLVDSFNDKLYAYNSYFHRAIRKYGVENFEFEEIYSNEDSTITEQDLNYWEKYFIEKYRTFIGFDDCNGYNMTLGGEGWTGRGKFIDVYDKDLNFIITYCSIEETSRELNLQSTNISAVINGRMISTGGYIFCESGKKPKPYVNLVNTKIDMYSRNREFIKTFNTMREVAIELNTHPTNIFDCCNHKQLTCNGFICLYHGDNINNHKLSPLPSSLDVYDNKSKKFIKTYHVKSQLKQELNICQSMLQRCLRTDNHLAGNYLIVPHGMSVE